MPCVGSSLLPDLLPSAMEYEVRRTARVFLPPVFSLVFSTVVWACIRRTGGQRSSDELASWAVVLSLVWIVASGVLWWLFANKSFAVPAG